MIAKILIIDDDKSTRVLIRLILESAGHCVFEAEDGMKGVKIFNENKIDLVVTDIIMPEKEGLETIIDIRNICPDVKIIAISSGGSDSADPNIYLKMANELGAQEVIAKPIGKIELLASVNALLEL